MNKDKKLSLIILSVGFIFFFFLGFNSLVLGKKSKIISYDEQVTVNKQMADKIEVFMFHTTQRCASCVNIGRYTKNTLEKYFKKELDSGKIIFREINIDLSENKEISRKFKAVGSSLFINTIYDEQDHIGEDTNVWRLAYDQEEVEIYFKNKIDSFLQK